jgi:rhodanese-related sulfurtransferase
MPATTLITTQQFSRLIGLPGTPAIVDVRIDDHYRSDPRLVPGSLRRDYRAIASWAKDYAGKSVVVVCQRGQKLSEGAAACLRHDGIEAQTLEGGFEAWKKANEPLVRTDKLPPRDDKGRNSDPMGKFREPVRALRQFCVSARTSVNCSRWWRRAGNDR